MVGVWVDQDECRRAGFDEIVKPFNEMKKNVEDLVLGSVSNMTWRGHLLRFAKMAGEGVRYLHSSRYFDVGSHVWKDCIIHRDLKPENMLITPSFNLKLTDFGEARATSNMNLTMTTVGTPIYMAPEVMRSEKYDSKADVYSFSICLVAMLRPAGTVVDYFFEALRCKMKRKDTDGIGERKQRA
jgi:serine/threonine protein kinase